MNQNHQGQLPPQNGVMNALMGYLQPQLQAQQGGAAPMQTFPQFQQQPVLPWPGWQPQANFAMPGGAQYMQQLMGQPMVPQQRPPAAAAPQPPSVDEIATAIVAAVQPLLQDKNASPVGSKPDDEKILVEALRKANASGLTPRQALEKLHNVNDHTETGWKNYFLDHLEKLYPKVYRDVRPSAPHDEVHRRASTSRTQAGPSSVSTRNDRSSPSRHAPPTVPRGRAKSPKLPPSQPSRRTLHKASPPRRHAVPINREPEVASSPSAVRSKRGDPIADYHAGTHIPPLSVNSKPKAPPKDPGSVRFSDDDKVFFIHYLRWRLQHEGSVPTRSDLYDELAEETPYRDAEAWKRHWDDHPELPDRILIEARNRELAAAQDESSEDEEGDDDQGDVEETEDPSTGRLLNGEGKDQRKHIVRLKVTDDDLRAMARYMVEKHAVWKSYPSQSACWEEFARHNTQRSLSAWMNIYFKRKKVIEQYAREYSQPHSGEEQKPPAPPSQPIEGRSVPHSQAAAVHSHNLAVGPSSTSQKRSASETRPGERDPPPIPKRIKREEPEYIDLTSD
ncbi:hypothetical protein L226DRAFT_131941 [Lentinus tigrinus ALCF2SS1-7]|uniref:Uncharacterized protein n=1 Tax=Lentinus tigrinus ALCF2SS1-6 TaxID=1328759 RepID=A0A5C2SW56_9APHY|nr:hypothetical protein L227DRAFT_569422 [Lentinus tigrinus ALCF2SS1-6]RPD81207.1 hypothetical protein L226DRAFT_131941 [Lentinus tigrinus ALCF2SS1-7]